MHFKELSRGALLAITGGILLAIALALHWYDLGNIHASLNSCKGPNTACTGWSSLSGLRYVLAIVALTPLVLAYVVVRGHALSWPRGQVTAIFALLGVILVIFVGLLDKPGTPRSEISITYGWWVALLATLLILFGAVWRTSESESQRKPPGVL